MDISEQVPNIIALKNVLEKNKCYHHSKVPRITVFDSTMVINCCCTEFHKECRKLAKELNVALKINGLIVK